MDVSLRTSSSAPRLPLTLRAPVPPTRDSSFQRLLAQASLNDFADAKTPSGNQVADQSSSTSAGFETLIFDVAAIPDGRALGTFTANLLKDPATVRSQAKTILLKQDRTETAEDNAVGPADPEKSTVKKQAGPQRKTSESMRRDQMEQAAINNAAQPDNPQEKAKPLSLLHLLAGPPPQVADDSATGDVAADGGQAASIAATAASAPDATPSADELAFKLTLLVPEVVATDDGSGSAASATNTQTRLPGTGTDLVITPADLSVKVSAQDAPVAPPPGSDSQSSGQDHQSNPPLEKASPDLPAVAQAGLYPMMFPATAEAPGRLLSEATHAELTAAAPSPREVSTPAADKSGLGPLQRMDVLLQTANQVVRLDIRQVMGTVKLSVHTSDSGLAEQLRHTLPDLVAKLDEQGFRPQTADTPRTLSTVSFAQSSAQSQSGQGDRANSGSADSQSAKQQGQRKPRRSWDDLATQMQEG